MWHKGRTKKSCLKLFLYMIYISVQKLEKSNISNYRLYKKSIIGISAASHSDFLKNANDLSNMTIQYCTLETWRARVWRITRNRGEKTHSLILSRVDLNQCGKKGEHHATIYQCCHPQPQQQTIVQRFTVSYYVRVCVF